MRSGGDYGKSGSSVDVWQKEIKVREHLWFIVVATKKCVLSCQELVQASWSGGQRWVGKNHLRNVR